MSNLKNKKNEIKNSYLTVSILGKSYKLNINYFNISNVKIIKKESEILIYLPNKYINKDNMDIINLSIKNLYTKIANTEIENCMELVRHILNFAPDDYLIKRINDGFYKSSKHVIIINPDIIQYSKQVIISTLITAFCKSKYRSNSNDYKQLLDYCSQRYESYLLNPKKISKVS